MIAQRTAHIDTDIVTRRLLRSQRPLGRFFLNGIARADRLVALCGLKSGPLLKRSFDVLASLMFMIVLGPIVLVAAALVRLEDGGPAFLVQMRVGRHGRQFKMYKLRSMVVNSDDRVRDFFSKNKHARGVTFKMQNDPRLTRVGRWIRKFSIDELPQLFNVFRGEMSIVGPRPPLPREVVQYTAFERRRLEVTPGLTCFWQIEGRSDLDFREQVKLDLKYIQTQSFVGDLVILLRTAPAVICCRGAY